MWPASRLYRRPGMMVVSESIPRSDGVCVTTGTRHLYRRGQLAEFEQESNTHSKQDSSTDSHSLCARNKAQEAP